ncbi:MAG: hypothetical protein AVDCRST_MAG76-589, partial [uncultured Acidimicrobiales bacterium]
GQRTHPSPRPRRRQGVHRAVPVRGRGQGSHLPRAAGPADQGRHRL